MSSNPLKPLRVMLIAILILLFFQYELGITVNFSNLPSIPAFGFSILQISDALHQAGSAALIHAILGAWLVILAAINLILSLRSKVRSAQVYGVLSFLSMIFAGGGGLFFVLSGFQDDNASHAMATNFLLCFVLLFLELYSIKPEKAKVN